MYHRRRSSDDGICFKELDCERRRGCDRWGGYGYGCSGGYGDYYGGYGGWYGGYPGYGGWYGGMYPPLGLGPWSYYY